MKRYRRLVPIWYAAVCVIIRNSCWSSGDRHKSLVQRQMLGKLAGGQCGSRDAWFSQHVNYARPRRGAL